MGYPGAILKQKGGIGENGGSVNTVWSSVSNNESLLAYSL